MLRSRTPNARTPTTISSIGSGTGNNQPMPPPSPPYKQRATHHLGERHREVVRGTLACRSLRLRRHLRRRRSSRVRIGYGAEVLIIMKDKRFHNGRRRNRLRNLRAQHRRLRLHRDRELQRGRQRGILLPRRGVSLNLHCRFRKALRRFGRLMGYTVLRRQTTLRSGSVDVKRR